MIELRRIRTGLYTASKGRGVNRRMFEIERDPDGYEPGWTCFEVGLEVVSGQYTGRMIVCVGESSLAAARAAMEAELKGVL